MKKIFISITLAFALTVYAGEEIKILKIKGEVLKNNKKIKLSESLNFGDEIKTSKNSFALIQVGSVFVFLEPNKAFKIQSDKNRENINQNIDKHLIVKYFLRKNIKPQSEEDFIDDLQQDKDKFKTYFLNEQYEKAVDFVEKVNLPLNEVDYLYMYAISNLKLDMRSKAIELFNKILEIKGSTYIESSYFGLFLAYLMSKDISHAKGIIFELQKKHPESGLIFIAKDLLKYEKYD